VPSPAWLDTSAIHGYALSRDAGVCDAINAGQHNMTAVANVLGLSVSSVS